MDEMTAVARLRPKPEGPAPAAVADARTRLRAAMAGTGEARPARHTMRWRLAGATALSVAVTAGLVTTEALRADRDGVLSAPPAAAAELLGKASLTAAAEPFTPPRADQFGYQDELIDQTDSRRRHREQSRVWLSVGDPDTTPRVCSRPVTDPPAQFDCEQPPNAMLPPAAAPGPRIDSYEYLKALPHDPQRLLGVLHRDVAAGREQPDPALTAGIIADLVANPLASPELRAALLTAVAGIPGITAADNVPDAAGRTGAAAAWTEDGIRHELIFDRNTHEYLGYRMVLVEAGRYTDLAGIPAGAVVHSTALLDSGIVDRPGQTP